MNDKALQSFDAQNNGQTVALDAPLDGAGCTDTIHCSNLHDFKGSFTSVHSGSEDALDLNNGCENVEMRADLWGLWGKTGITIKGGSHGIKVSGMVAGKGIVELGGWSDQSHDKTTGISLDLKHISGGAIPVRVLLADAPSLANGPYRYLFPSPSIPLHGFFVWWFMILRRLGFWR